MAGKKKKQSARVPQRPIAHWIDSKAKAKLAIALSKKGNWVLRDLSERDYGIDVMLERFTKQDSTGQVVFGQLKGREKPVRIRDDKVPFRIGKKTLLYAEQFPEPFFLLFTSTIQTEPVYFLWLQKYIAIVLDRDEPQWRKSKSRSLTVFIPTANTLENQEAKLVEIAGSTVMDAMSFRFVKLMSSWENAYEELTAGNYNVKQQCLSLLQQFRELSPVIQHYDPHRALPSFFRVRDCIEAYDLYNADDFPELSDFVDRIGLTKTSIDAAQQIEEFANDEGGLIPY